MPGNEKPPAAATDRGAPNHKGTSMTFDLTTTIREALDGSDSPDPCEIASVVAGLVPGRQVRAVLAALLPDAVREQIRAERRPAESAGKNGRSGLGDMTQDPARMRRWIPGGGWKFEAEMSAADCDAVADHYFGLAAANENEGKTWRSTADLMRRAGVARLADLGRKDAA